MSNFMSYIRQLKDVKPISIEPHVEKLTEDQQRSLREEQDLSSGAVRIAIMQADSSSTTKPQDGDLVFFHYTVREEGLSKVLASTESVHGGGGSPHAAVVGKGLRIPRGWELGMADMQEGQRAMLRTSAAYGFEHCDCSMARPSGIPSNKELSTEIELLKIIPAEQVHVNPVDPSVIKVKHKSGPSWETPRQRYEVSFSIHITKVSQADAPADWTVKTATLGSGALPPGLETALSSMSAEEEATFVMPALALEGGSDAELCAPGGGALAAVHIKLRSFVEVRDMTGDGQLMKRKIKQGQGSFPVDCAINDATVTIHYSVRAQTSDGTWGEPLFDTRASSPLQFSTGEGNMPQGVEMALKLMLPGESCQLICSPKYGYSTSVAPPPPGVPTDAATLRFDIDLIEFEKEGHPQAMDADQIIAWAQRQKDAANNLYKTNRTNFAIQKYDKTLRTLEAFRECETDEHFEKVTELKVAMLSNLAAAYIQTQEYMEAVKRCDAALSLDEGNMKIVLRRAKALSLNGDFQACRDCCDQVACGEQVTQKEVDELRSLNARREKEAGRKQKSEFKNFFDRQP